MTEFEFTGAAVVTDLDVGINDTATTITLSNATNWPTGPGSKVFVLTVGDADNGDVLEKVLCASRSGTSVTVSQRGYEGTAAAEWGAGTRVAHTISATAMQEASDHVNDATVHMSDADHAAIVHTAAMLGTDSVGSDEIAAGAVGSTELATGAVIAGKIAAAAIDGSGLFAAGVVDAAALAADSVGASELADNAVDTAAVQDDAVTAAKIDPDVETQGKIIAQQILTADDQHTASGDTDMVLNNVPVVAGHTYAIHLHTQVQINLDREWQVYLKVNGVNHDRFGTIDGSTPRRPLDATLYWDAPTTQATDDFLVALIEGADGATLTLQGTSTARRTLTITDLGVL